MKILLLCFKSQLLIIGSCCLVPLGQKLRNPKLEIFHRKEQNFNFKKLNRVECTTFKTFISILNSIACALRAHVSICLNYIMHL